MTTHDPARKKADGPLLVIVPNVGMAVDGDRVFLDIKATEGLRLYADLWPGSVLCLSRAVPAGSFGYGTWIERASLPFAVKRISIDAEADEIAQHCAGAALVLGGADSHLDLGLPKRLAPTPVALIIEYTMKTRFDILRLERRGLVSKLKTALWLLRTERKRRRAMAAAAAIQANGTPAFDAYRAKGRDDLLYFDTRLTRDLAIDPEAAMRKVAGITEGRTLRLAFSGRLEPMKGADHLVAVLKAVHARGATHATLDIYGDGSLRDEIARQVEAARLTHAVRLHGPVDFEEELVPALRSDVDLFVCCHPQADPSCTYLETLGCGVPIAGYRNAAFAGVLGLGECGVAVEIGDDAALADAIVALDRDRPRFAILTHTAAAIGTANLFEDEFEARVRHLRRIARLD